MALNYPNVLIPHVGPELAGLRGQRLPCHLIFLKKDNTFWINIFFPCQRMVDWATLILMNSLTLIGWHDNLSQFKAKTEFLPNIEVLWLFGKAENQCKRERYPMFFFGHPELWLVFLLFWATFLGFNVLVGSINLDFSRKKICSKYPKYDIFWRASRVCCDDNNYENNSVF